jgi:hypothetical protein
MIDYECIVHMTFEESGIRDFRCRELAATPEEAVGKCRDRLKEAWPSLVEIDEVFATIPVESVPITAKPYAGDNLREI